MKDAYTVKETAQRLGIAEQTVRKLVKDGDLPSIRVSPRRIIIPVTALEGWLAERSHSA